MKTTMDLDDQLLRQAKIRCAKDGVTLRAFVEDALRARLLPVPSRPRKVRWDLPVVKGTAPPNVDVSDREALYDLMERS